jgi:hypothetical protein
MVPVPFRIHGHRRAVVADKDVSPLKTDVSSSTMSAARWMVNISDETRPVPTTSFQVEGLDGRENPGKTACHQPVETITGNEVPVAWFAQGIRTINISNPRALRETAYFVPIRPKDLNAHQAMTCMSVSGLPYLIDRFGGPTILQRS